MPGAPLTDLGIGHHGDHREKTGKRDQTEAVDQGTAAGDGAGQSQPQGRDQRDRHGRGGHATGVIGQRNNQPGRECGLHDDHDVAGDNVIVQRGARDNAVGAERDPHGRTERHRDAQTPHVNGAAGHGLRLDGHGQQGGFGDGGGKTDGGAEQIDPFVVLPPQDGRHFAGRPIDELRIGQLFRHQFAEWKQRLFQPDEEQAQPDQYVDEPG